MRFRPVAYAALILLLSACVTSRPVPVLDRQLIRCPAERVVEPECLAPPPKGTEREQGDVFRNERACYERARSWDMGWMGCAAKE